MQPFSKVVAGPPATLTFDLSVPDEELGDLLAHRWTVWLRRPPGSPYVEPMVIAPPPSSSELTWHFSASCKVSAVLLLCDAGLVKEWPYEPMSFEPGDSLCVTVVLTVDS